MSKYINLKYIFNVSTLFLLLLLSGCAFNYTGEAREFTYQSPFVSFQCTHKPIDLSVKVENVMKSLEEKGELNELMNDALMPEVKELVRLCQKLIRDKEIAK